MRIAARRRQIETASPSVAKENGEAESNEDKPKFWRYPSEALDRYEAWLDANLPAMRAETIEREEQAVGGYGVVAGKCSLNHEHFS